MNSFSLLEGLSFHRTMVSGSFVRCSSVRSYYRGRLNRTMDLFGKGCGNGRVVGMLCPNRLHEKTGTEEWVMGYEEALQLIKEAAETGATKLDLYWQDLTELPSELFQLTKLTKLNLWHNQLSSLPPEIVNLANLQVLYLSLNRLSLLPSQLTQLTNLQKLDLINNQLSIFPIEIAQLTNLRELHLDGNPLVSPPIEIAEEGIEAIREYFAEVDGETREAAEVKVILVGEGASGKTSLTRCLRGEPFNPHEATTHGIRIKQWKLTCACRDLCCNLWDFGGQDHACHPPVLPFPPQPLCPCP
ncbi:MAG: hypothetical protein D3912_15860 [Candidatus Electrothrix sp. AX1]|nr:hypothetical protein [Candidatus Electrothrix sp. AX1]